MGGRSSRFREDEQVRPHVDKSTPILDLGPRYHDAPPDAPRLTRPARRTPLPHNARRSTHPCLSCSTLHFSPGVEGGQHGGYFTRPSREGIQAVAGGALTVKSSAAFCDVKPVGTKALGANKIFYVKRRGKAGDRRQLDASRNRSIGDAKAVGRQKKKGQLDCIFCGDIPSTPYLSTKCLHVGCRKCWLAWCKEHRENSKCPECGVKAPVSVIEMMTQEHKRASLRTSSRRPRLEPQGSFSSIDVKVSTSRRGS